MDPIIKCLKMRISKSSFITDVTCFQGFFQFPDMQAILEHFCVYHLNAPGQHDGAAALDAG